MTDTVARSLYVDLDHGTRGGRCQISKDGLVCLEHGRGWPCPIGELRAQIVAALVELWGKGEPTAVGHLERALELSGVVQ